MDKNMICTICKKKTNELTKLDLGEIHEELCPRCKSDEKQHLNLIKAMWDERNKRKEN